MNLIIFLCSAIMFSSLLIGALVFSLVLWNKKVSHWPTLWATSILTVVASSLLALVFLLSPEFGPELTINIGTRHAPLGPNDVMQWGSVSPAQIHTDLLANINTLAVITYFSGVTFFLLRLINGRRRAIKIAENASFVDTLSDIEYWETNATTSPFAIRRTVGGNSHQIIVPTNLIQKLSETELMHILKHELAHTQRRDDEWGLLLRTLVALTWFTPITHLLFSRWAQSIEIQCDLNAISNEPDDSRQNYAHTLLKTLKLANNSSESFPVPAFTDRHIRNEKRRLHAILRGTGVHARMLPQTLLVIIGAFSLTLGSAVFMSANAEPGCQPKNARLYNHNDFNINGKISSRYNHTRDPFKEGKKRKHAGVDIAAPAGTKIYAPASGVIVTASNNYRNNPKYGKVLVIETAPNIRTVLAHLESYQVQSGQQVDVGDSIATIGNTGASTGPHVHIETYVNNVRVDPESVWILDN